MPKLDRVIVIDDDPGVLSALAFLFASAGLAVETFASAQAFFDHPLEEGPFCLMLDLQLPGMDGLSVQERLAHMGRPAAIVFLSGAADVPSTAAAMRSGAVDFLVKPVDDAVLLDAVTRALAQAEEARQQRTERAESAQRVARLTARERQVVDLVSRGLLNKQIASELGISEETVKVHRRHAMRKLDVDSVPSLVRLIDRSAP
jgi:RNA polymerase sigma factor (sigma-70 family)